MEIKLKVKGMVCNGCEKRVINVLAQIDEVDSVDANHETGEVLVKLNKEIDKSILIEKIDNLGFEVL